MIRPRYCPSCGAKMEPTAQQAGFDVQNGTPKFNLYLTCQNKKCFWYGLGGRFDLITTDASLKQKNEWIGSKAEPTAIQRFMNFIFGK